ncbi:hypothetical protein [Alkalisalibacterium limincola]|uniref:hypothetical protein n=1 Tax=Alkalisalibacterium limincola TaxID=2699169 RepID=UPI00164F5446|nr:hypothetical protein [Alkalisalibacterium limincola]
MAEIVDDLTWRAARGEPEAACRLAMELGVCAVDLHRSWLLCEDREGNPTVCRGHLGYVSEHDGEVDWPRHVADVAAHCDGAPIVMPRELLAKFRRAAFLGSVQAMTFYMSASGWMDGNGGNIVRRPPRIWPEDSTEARLQEQHHSTLAWTLFNAGHAGVAGSLVGEAMSRFWSAWEDESDDLAQTHAIEVMALIHYDIDVRNALGFDSHWWPTSKLNWANDHSIVSSVLSDEQIAQAEAKARHLRETITLLPGQGADVDRVRRNVDGTRYGGLFAPSAMARCDQVVPAP